MRYNKESSVKSFDIRLNSIKSNAIRKRKKRITYKGHFHNNIPLHWLLFFVSFRFSIQCCFFFCARHQNSHKKTIVTMKERKRSSPTIPTKPPSSSSSSSSSHHSHIATPNSFTLWCFMKWEWNKSYDTETMSQNKKRFEFLVLPEKYKIYKRNWIESKIHIETEYRRKYRKRKQKERDWLRIELGVTPNSPHRVYNSCLSTNKTEKSFKKQS